MVAVESMIFDVDKNPIIAFCILVFAKFKLFMVVLVNNELVIDELEMSELFKVEFVTNVLVEKTELDVKFVSTVFEMVVLTEFKLEMVAFDEIKFVEIKF